MTDDAARRWARLSALFDAALELPTGARAAYVEAQCSDDRALRDELLRMLDAADSDGILDHTPDAGGLGLPPAGERISERLRSSIADRYVIEHEIGRGGMGAIYLAHELKHQRGVILKVLRPDVAASVGRQRFEAEVRIAAQLAHPHIVPLLDSGEADGLLYFVMPRIPGETLRERLKRVGQLPVADAMRILRDIADALAHAHEAGVVHRDLKPENILCSGDHAFLLDFGIAQWTEQGEERITNAGLAVGTPRYMAPEQAAGRAVDHRADIYAWGLVAREMLLGPRASELDLTSARSDIPDALASLIYRCLVPDPGHRPRNAGTLVAAIDAIVSGAPMPALPAAPPPRRLGWRIAGWSAAAAAVAAATALLVKVPTTVMAGDLRMPIAVAPFREESADSGRAIRGRLAGAWITQGLHETGLFQVVPWPAVLEATEGGGDALAALRQLGAGTIVTGSFFETDEGLALQVEVREARRGSMLAALEPVTVPRDSSALAIRLVRERVMGALAARRDPRFSGVAKVLEHPPTFDAYREFERALGHFNAQRYRESIPGFRRAVELDSAFVSPLVYAAQAAWNTTQFALLDTLLATLDARRGELTDYHDGVRTFLRAVYSGDGVAALDAATRSARIAPQSRAAFDAGVVAFWLGRPTVARERLEALDPDRGAMLGWPSYWTNLAHARHLTGDHAAELRATRQMRARHPATRVAWTLEARALAALIATAPAGDGADRRALDSLLAAADTLPADTYWSLGSMLAVAGDELAAHGDTASGRAYHVRAEAWLRAQLERDRDNIDHLFWYGTTLHQLGRFREAHAVLARHRALVPDRRSSPELEALAAERAGVAGALAALPAPEPHGQAERLVAHARLAAARGDTAVALERMRDALRTGYRRWPWLHGTAWRDFSGLAGDTAFARLTGLSHR